MELEKQVLEMLEEVCEESGLDADLELDLFENDLLDSLGIAELLVAIEDRFGVVISPSEIQKEDIGTPARIIALIQGRMNS